MDPVMLKNQNEYEYDYKTDIWGLGIVCYKFLIGENPFKTQNEFSDLLKVLKIGIYKVPKTLSKEIVSFLNCMLQYEANKRLN